MTTKKKSDQGGETEQQVPEDRERTMQERIPDEAQTLDAQETLKRGERQPGDYSAGDDQDSAEQEADAES